LSSHKTNYIIDVSTRNVSNWKVLQLYYDNILYDSVSDLRQAMASPGFRKIGLNLDGDWTSIEDFTRGSSKRDLPPPAMVQSSSARFNIDRKERLVSWLGFEFFISTSLDVGAALHDIRFNGDSVIYEIGLQEAMVHYAGNDPFQGGQAYLDTVTEMGAEMFELVPGYDCPAYATFLSTTFHTGDSTYTNKNSIYAFLNIPQIMLSSVIPRIQEYLSREIHILL
jgi:primary-amine oxidase